MSLSSAQSAIASVQRDILSLQRKLADLAREEASKSSKIASVTGSINKSTSPSSLESKHREIQRLHEDIARIQEKKASASKDIAAKTERLHKAEQDYYKVQATEHRRALEAITAQSREREQSAFRELHAAVLVRSSESELPSTRSYDAFISHATEDKEELVRPLAELLSRSGHAIWYDEFQLKVGDSLRRSIDRGLARSRFGIVVLSPSFFAKNWPQYELDGLTAKEMAGGKVILPLWHKVSKNEVLGYSPSLADKVALSTSSFTIEELAAKLSEVLSET